MVWTGEPGVYGRKLGSVPGYVPPPVMMSNGKSTLPTVALRQLS